jgi:hypothetical protein
MQVRAPQIHRGRSFVAAALLAALLLVLVVPTGAQAATDATFAGQMSSLRAVLDRTVSAYADRTDASDPRYYADGLFVAPFTGCHTCALGPAIGAAVLSDTRPELLPIVRASVDRAIAEHQRANGAYFGPGNSDAIQTAWTIPSLGTIYLTVADRLDAGTRTRWASSIVAAADWLLTARETVWYVNGNINLAYTRGLWLAWRISGEERFRAAYEASWSFTIDPPKPRWAAFGLRYTKAPTRADGADGAAYLVENGGFDPSYTMAQLDIAASWYAFSRDPRALRLMNLLVNQLLPLVGPTFTLDARNGSRQNYLTPFMTSALSVLVGSGARPDLAALLPGQLARVAKEYAGAITYTHPNFYGGVGGWLSTPLIFAQGLPAVPAVPAAPKPAVPAVPAAPKPAPASTSPRPASRPAAPTRPSSGSAAVVRSAAVSLAPRVRIRGGALTVAVSVPRGVSVSATLRCGTRTCGRARAVRGTGGRPVRVRVRVSRTWQRAIRRSRGRRAVAVVTVRSGSASRTIRRSVRLVA